MPRTGEYAGTPSNNISETNKTNPPEAGPRKKKKKKKQFPETNHSNGKTKPLKTGPPKKPIPPPPNSRLGKTASFRTVAY